MEEPDRRPWFTDADADYYAEYLGGPSEKTQRNFRTLLATIGEVLGETNVDALLRKLVEHALATTRSERGILLLERDGRLEVRVALDAEGRDLGLHPPLARTVPERVFREGRPIIQSVTSDHDVLDVSQSAASLRLRQVMCALLRARGQALGVIYVDSTVRGGGHTDEDLRLFHAQAGLMGMAVENHRMFEEAWNARDVARQLAVARDIQLRLYPAPRATIAGVELAGLSAICAQVGGDYFDYLPLDGDRVGIGLGDVSGHGIAPALVMSDVRARLRSLLRTRGKLRGIYGQMNLALCAELTEGMYVALFVAVYDPARRRLEYQNAGHAPPLLYRAQDGRLEEIEPNAPALGLFADLSAGACPALEVSPGDTLVCYTDGVADRPDRRGDLYGLARLKDTVRRAAREGAGADEIARSVEADCEAHAGGRPLRDDFTLLVARF